MHVTPTCGPAAGTYPGDSVTRQERRVSVCCIEQDRRSYRTYAAAAMDALTPEGLAALLARLKGLIDEARALQSDFIKKTTARRALDRAISQPLGPRIAK
jgi:hypothetical protein